jgi:FAD:protein FMN transferase
MVQLRILIIIILLASVSCADHRYTHLHGKTMGTYYEIQYNAAANYQSEIDSLLDGFIMAASTYDSTSEISQFNKAGEVVFESPHLFRMLTMATTFHKETDGMFEPTLMPLIRAHGFSNGGRKALSEATIDSLLTFVSLSFIQYDSNQMTTSKPGVQLDLSAMGEGYAIDMIADFLESRNVDDYKVEIGAEMRCKGKNAAGELWLIGIEMPTTTENNILTTVRIDNQAISTSGTSRRFYIDESGVKRSHIIDPRTGHSIKNNLLSVTVRDRRAVRADVLATALMVMGIDSARHFTEKMNLQALLVYEENGKVLSWSSEDFLKTRGTASR